MKHERLALFTVAQLVAAMAMFPTIAPAAQSRYHRPAPVPYHRDGYDTVLMDWDLPKGKRAKRRSRARRKPQEQKP